MGKLTDAEKLEVVAKYLEGGLSQRAIGEQYGIRGASVHSLLKVRGHKPRGLRKYTLDEDYFDRIGPNQAYFLGLLLSDGYNCETSHQVTLELIEQDQNILEKFAAELKTNRPFQKIQQLGCRNRIRFCVNSVKLSNRLADLGVKQRKTFEIRYPDWLDPALDRHFIRGYVDGDGHIGDATVNIVGTEPFCRSVTAKYQENLGVHVSVGRCKRMWLARVGGRLQARKVCEWLYKDAEMYMERKYQKALEVMAGCPLHKGSLAGKQYMVETTEGEI